MILKNLFVFPLSALLIVGCSNSQPKPMQPSPAGVDGKNGTSGAEPNASGTATGVNGGSANANASAGGGASGSGTSAGSATGATASTTPAIPTGGAADSAAIDSSNSGVQIFSSNSISFVTYEGLVVDIGYNEIDPHKQVLRDFIIAGKEPLVDHFRCKNCVAADNFIIDRSTGKLSWAPPLGSGSVDGKVRSFLIQGCDSTESKCGLPVSLDFAVKSKPKLETFLSNDNEKIIGANLPLKTIYFQHAEIDFNSIAPGPARTLAYQLHSQQKYDYFCTNCDANNSLVIDKSTGNIVGSLAGSPESPEGKNYVFNLKACYVNESNCSDIAYLSLKVSMLPAAPKLDTSGFTICYGNNLYVGGAERFWGLAKLNASACGGTAPMTCYGGMYFCVGSVAKYCQIGGPNHAVSIVQPSLAGSNDAFATGFCQTNPAN